MTTFEYTALITLIFLFILALHHENVLWKLRGGTTDQLSLAAQLEIRTSSHGQDITKHRGLIRKLQDEAREVKHTLSAHGSRHNSLRKKVEELGGTLNNLIRVLEDEQADLKYAVESVDIEVEVDAGAAHLSAITKALRQLPDAKLFEIAYGKKLGGTQ